MRRLILIIFCLMIQLSLPLYALTSTDSIPPAPADTVAKPKGLIEKIIQYFDNSNKGTSDKKLDFSFIGGPSYSDNTKLSLAVLGAALYKSRYDSLTPVSEASAYVEGAITGFYQVGLRGTHIAPEDKWRIPYDVDFESYPTYFWGIGYSNNIDDGNETKFKQLSSTVSASLEWQVAKSLFLGPAADFQYTKATDIREWAKAKDASPDYQSISLWQGEDLRQLNLGFGFNFSYDTRDFISNAYSGVYLCLEQRFFPGGMMNDKFFGSTEITANSYNRVWKGGIIASQIHGRFTYGQTPWSMLSYFGGSHSMRGYYKARFRDKCEADFTVELRQHIWRRNSMVVWVGAGNVFPSFNKFELSHTLPNYGIGYRWEFKKRTNVRVDIGFGRHCKGLEFNISEIF